MRCYLIREKLENCESDSIRSWDCPYVAVATREEFEQNAALFDMGIDLEIDYALEGVSRLRINYDSLTGHLFIPNKKNPTEKSHSFPFALDEKGIVFLNDDGTAQQIIDRIQRTKRWKVPCIERFLYDFLEGIISEDMMILEAYEKEMDAMEDMILDDKPDEIMERLVDIRSEIMDLRTHYEQLVDVGQELEENESNFFKEDNLRFFRLFVDRVERLQGTVNALKDHTMQVRDLYNTQMGERQNRNMSYLTVILSVFTPLTLITSWYGMNFKYMPELDEPWAYPLVVLVCIIVVILFILFFKKKKLL